MYYDINITLSHNCPINMVVGPMGAGKTYGVKKKLVDNFYNTGEQFVYLRRYGSELDIVKDGLFDDIIKDDACHKMDIKRSGENYLFDDQIAGHLVDLNTATRKKGKPFPNVTWLLFDEFIVNERLGEKYLRSEHARFLTLLETVFRTRKNKKVFLLGNSFSFYNPYTVSWDIKPPFNKNWSKSGDKQVLYHLPDTTEYQNFKKETDFGKHVSSFEFGKMSIENKFINDEEYFIEKKPGTAFYHFTFVYLGEKFGVWLSYQEGKYYVSNDVDKYCKRVFAITDSDHSPNAMLLQWNRSTGLDKLINEYLYGRVRFENQRCKKIFKDIIKNVY